MNKKQYLEKRNGLLAEAQACIDDGRLEDFEAKKAEIEALDEQFENAATAQANLEAVRDQARVTDLSAHSVQVHGTVAETMNDAASMDDPLNTTEYRTAFMNHVVSGVNLPAEFRNADQNTKTGDVGVLIPTTIMQRIIEKIESKGMILPLVTRTAYKGGVKIPTSSVKPTASWVSEGAGSPKQKKTIGYIDFAYNKLRCAISVSLETDVMALPVFEATFVANVSEAMLIALERSIVSGTGNGQPKGILAETPEAGQALEIAAGDKLSYNTLIDAEAALPLAYESGAVWMMTKKSFMTFAGMVDANKQPIARVNYGIGGQPERTLLGRSVVLTEYMDSYADTAASDTLFAALFNFKDYVLNTNLNVTVKRYEDNETDDQVMKAIMLVDGKVVDKRSLVTLTKKASA
jgi:HK97 family phage major capsid protein